MVATTKLVRFDFLIRLTAISIGLLLLLMLWRIAPTLGDTNRAVADAYKNCNRYYQEQLDQYGIRQRLTFTLDNVTMFPINNYSGGGYNAS